MLPEAATASAVGALRRLPVTAGSAGNRGRPLKVRRKQLSILSSESVLWEATRLPTVVAVRGLVSREQYSNAEGEPCCGFDRVSS
jgi:hypothetical protein